MSAKTRATKKARIKSTALLPPIWHQARGVHRRSKWQGKARQQWIIALTRPACKLGPHRGRGRAPRACTKQASLPRPVRYTPPMRLKNKTAVVIGAGQSPGEGMGNGRATVLRFAQEGARVLAVDNRLASAEET